MQVEEGCTGAPTHLAIHGKCTGACPLIGGALFATRVHTLIIFNVANASNTDVLNALCQACHRHCSTFCFGFATVIAQHMPGLA